MKISILDQFASDAISAPAVVTGGCGSPCKPPTKKKSKSTKSNKCKPPTVKKSKSSKSKGGCTPPPPPCGK
jgi:hypothetical protein